MGLVREHINEKFSQDSDPIRDMNIGIRPYLRKIWDAECRRIGPKHTEETYEEYFKRKDDSTYMNLVAMGIYIALDELSKESVKDDNTAYEYAIKYLKNYCLRDIHQLERFAEVKKQIKDYLNNNLHTNITVKI